MKTADWQNHDRHAIGLLLATPGEAPLLIIINAFHDQMSFRMPAPQPVQSWRCVADSGRGVIEPNDEPVAPGVDLPVAERAVLLFEGRQ